MLAPMNAAPPRGQRRGRLGCLSALALVVLMPVALYIGLSPWALHMGGGTTVNGWKGFGEVKASNGGRYVLFLFLWSSVLDNMRSGRHSGGISTPSDNVAGTAKLCTKSGATYTFKVGGRIEAWWTTDGARTRLRLDHSEPVHLPGGWDVALHGTWNGPALELASPDNSFTEVFTPRGEIRHVTSTADAGTARVTLRQASEADFAAACRVLSE
jgi:hypothetical protein